MRKIFFFALAGLIVLGTALSLQSPGATPSYAEGLAVNTATATASATTTASPSATVTPTPTGTPTFGPVRFPIIFRQPTLTPSSTATPTTTKTPTVTPTPTKTVTGVPGATGLTGHIARVDASKPSYATFIENVKFYEWISNSTGQTVSFGILGVNTTGPVNLPFRTSWDGAGVPGGYLNINAGCRGPAGIPCSSGDGRHEDHVGDGPAEHSPYEIKQPGVYQLTFHVCYSSYTACQQPGGNWQQLSGPVSFTAIHWTPSPDEFGGATATPEYQTSDDDPVCYLITDDPRGTYLSCPKPEAKHRQLIRTR